MQARASGCADLGLRGIQFFSSCLLQIQMPWLTVLMTLSAITRAFTPHQALACRRQPVASRPSPANDTRARRSRVSIPGQATDFMGHRGKPMKARTRQRLCSGARRACAIRRRQPANRTAAAAATHPRVDPQVTHNPNLIADYVHPTMEKCQESLKSPPKDSPETGIEPTATLPGAQIEPSNAPRDRGGKGIRAD